MSDVVHDHSAPRPDNPAVTHEHADVNVRGILITAGVLTGAAIAIHLICWWMFDAFAAREGRNKPSPFPLAAEERDQLPPPPVLEGIAVKEGKTPYVHADALQGGAQPRLESYGWVDEKAGVVHIPIDRAMKILIEQKKLPTRAAKEARP